MDEAPGDADVVAKAPAGALAKADRMGTRDFRERREIKSRQHEWHEDQPAGGFGLGPETAALRHR